MRKFAILMLILLLTAHAEDFVVINSDNGKDVLSGISYANVKNLPVKFMPINGDVAFFANKIGSNHDILLIQGGMPVSAFVETALRNKDNILEIYTSTDTTATNLELARRSGAKKFIIVDSAYSDSALSVLSYAAFTDSYVILSNKENANDIVDVVKDAERIIVYGLVDEDVASALANLDLEIIGKGEDKFEDNVLIVDKTMKEYSLKTVMVVDGTFIEEGMANGQYPILLTGKIMPVVTYEFIKSKVRTDELTSMVLIGKDHVNSLYDTRERMETELENEGLNKTLALVVKFAQVMPSAGTGVLELDIFPLPTYKPTLEITEIAYNEQTQKVILGLDNTGDGAAYYNIELRLQLDGNDYQIFSTDETTIIERGEQIGAEYPINFSSIEEGSINAIVIVRYGSSKKSLEEFVSDIGPLVTINYVDNSNVSIKKVRYDKKDGVILVTIRNNNNEPVYVFSKISLLIDGIPTNISSADTRSIDPGSIIVEEFPLELTEEDLVMNDDVTVFIDYGGRPGFLMKHATYMASLEHEDDYTVLFGIGILIIILITAYYIMRKLEKTG